MTCNNDDRAGFAQAAIDVFQADTGVDKEDAIADLICDLCHLAASYGQDAIHEVRRGLRMYADERDYPPDGWAPEGLLADVDIIITRGR